VKRKDGLVPLCLTVEKLMFVLVVSLGTLQAYCNGLAFVEARFSFEVAEHDLSWDCRTLDAWVYAVTCLVA
jgi:hypothetical protein